jgi:hypothetical protein
LKFAHLWQVLSREKPVGPVVSLTMRDNKVVVLRERPGDKTLASMALDDFKGKQVEHRMQTKFGPKGFFNYTLVDLGTGETLMSTSFHGSLGKSMRQFLINLVFGSLAHLHLRSSGSTSIKTGFYRALTKNAKPAKAYVGGFVAKKMA